MNAVFCRFEIVKAQDVTLSPAQVGMFLKQECKPSSAQQQYMSSGPMVAMVLRKRNAITVRSHVVCFSTTQ